MSQREIKFRAFVKADGVFHHVLSIDLHDQEVFLADRPGGGSWYSFDDVNLIQYTGLKDSKGKEIYEGDILSDGRGSPCIVRFNTHSGRNTIGHGESVSYLRSGWYVATRDDVTRMRIVGNIYEHPHLIKDVDTQPDT